MTIAQLVQETLASLPISKQRQVLALARKLRPAKKPSTRRERGASKEIYVPKDPALRAIAGMWEDRTDLPKDPVQAVKALRKRMWGKRNDV